MEAGHEQLRAYGARRISALVGGEEAEAASFWTALGYDHDPKVARFVRTL